MGSLIVILIVWGLFFLIKFTLFPSKNKNTKEYEKSKKTIFSSKKTIFSSKNSASLAVENFWKYGDLQTKIEDGKIENFQCKKCSLIYWNRNNDKKLTCSNCRNTLTQEKDSYLESAYTFFMKGLIIPLGKSPANKYSWTIYIYDITKNDEKDFERVPFQITKRGQEAAKFRLKDKKFEKDESIFSYTKAIFNQANTKITEDTSIIDWTKYSIIYKDEFMHPFSGKRRILFKQFLTNDNAEFNQGKIINKNNLIRELSYENEYIFENEGYLDKGFERRKKHREYIKDCINLIKVSFDINDKSIDDIIYPLKNWIGLKLETLLYDEYQEEIDNDEDEGYDLADINIEIEKKYFSSYLEHYLLEKDENLKHYRVLYKLLLNFRGNDKELVDLIEDPYDAIDYTHTDKVLEDITNLLFVVLWKNKTLRTRQLSTIAHHLIPWYQYGEYIDKSYFIEKRDDIFSNCTDIIFEKDFYFDRYLYLNNFEDDYDLDEEENCEILFNQYEIWSERLALPDKDKSQLAKKICDNIVYHRKKMGCANKT